MGHLPREPVKGQAEAYTATNNKAGRGQSTTDRAPPSLHDVDGALRGSLLPATAAVLAGLDDGERVEHKATTYGVNHGQLGSVGVGGVRQAARALLANLIVGADDEAYAQLLSRLRQALKEITGRESARAEAERRGELAELLVTELKIVAGRTGSVSNVPAFLTEHLRRRLWKKGQRQLEEEGKSVTGVQGGEAAADASKCPDCFGTGMWYPGGFEKGVARCGHEKLITAD